MNAIKLACNRCGWETGLSNSYFCEECGDSLEVIYDYGKVDRTTLKQELDSASGIWDYKNLLPIKNGENIISLSEGNTPLIKSSYIGPRMDVDLLFKDETRNPSCSFKDRPNSVAISMAKELGIDSVTIASTGNAGSSLSAFAAKASMACTVFVPENTPQAKITQSATHGARIIKVRGNYADSFKMALAASRKYTWANLTSTYLNPYTVEGDKTIAYELYRQMNGVAPDWIVVPLGAGALLTGIYKAFVELEQFGLIDKLPRMLGVQAQGCSPIIRAFRNDDAEVQAFENPSTIADAICDPLNGYARDGTRTLKTIRMSSGAGVEVTDEQIIESVLELARREGIFCEPGSATALAAVKTAMKENTIKKGETVVALITGHGLKTIEDFISIQQVEGDAIRADISELDKLFN